MTVKMLAFTSCGHCPLAIVKLHGKCEPMDVYCPLQFDEDGTYKLICQTSYIGKLREDCPLPPLEKWQKKLSELTTKKEQEDFVEKTRFFARGQAQHSIKYSQSAFRKSRGRGVK